MAAVIKHGRDRSIKINGSSNITIHLDTTKIVVFTINVYRYAYIAACQKPDL